MGRKYLFPGCNSSLRSLSCTLIGQRRVVDSLRRAWAGPILANRPAEKKVYSHLLFQSDSECRLNFMKLTSAIFWTVLTTFFGLLQLIIVILVAFFDENKNVDWGKIRNECSLLFFCTGLVAAIAVDRFWSKIKGNKLSSIGMAYVLFPCMILFFSIIIYCVVYLGSADPVALGWAQVAIFAMTFSYAVAIKKLMI